MPTGFQNSKRIDPYKTFKFRVKFGTKTVLGISKVSALKRTTEVVKHRDGGQNSFDHKSPGRTTYDAVTMERGLTHDRDFEDWANMVHKYPEDSTMDLANYKRDVTVEMQDEKGHTVYRYFLHNCWVSEFTSSPELNSNANALAIESLKIEIEGWDRDADLKEPKLDDPVPPPA
jgi:phage tail-like protein